MNLQNNSIGNNKKKRNKKRNRVNLINKNKLKF